jgi:phosphate transport system permease protein
MTTQAQQAPDTAPPRELRVRIRRVSAEGVLTLAGAGFGALALTWVLYERILPTTGVLGFWVSWYVIFLLMYAGMAALQWDKLAVRDKVASVALGTGGLLTCALVFYELGYVLLRGLGAVTHLTFFTQTLAGVGQSTPLGVGGVFGAIVGTLEMIALATLFSVPLGILSALFLGEVGGAWARPVRTLIEAMTSLPDIIAGLFVLAFFIYTLGLQHCALAASLALAVTMLPIIARGSEAVLRLVPNMLREASYALGASQWRTVWNVVLPTARSGLATAVVLGMARGIGETAPVLLTAGYIKGQNFNPVSGWTSSLPILILNEHALPGNNDLARAFGAGFTLVLLVLILFTTARVLGGKRPGELSRRNRRRIASEVRR